MTDYEVDWADRGGHTRKKGLPEPEGTDKAGFNGDGVNDSQCSV